MKNSRTQQIKHMASMLLMLTGLLLQSCSSDKSNGNNEVKAPSMDVHAAAFMGDVKAIKQHIAAKTDLNQKDQFGSSPLTIAATFGKTDVAIALIDGDADLSVTSADGSSPLHTAAFFGRTAIVENLLAKGADIGAKNNFGFTALQSIMTPFEEVKPVYDEVSRQLGPLGLKLDYEELALQRKAIVELIEDHQAK